MKALCKPTVLLVSLLASPISFGNGVSGHVEYGIGHVSDSAFRYGRYSGLTDQGGAPWLNFEFDSSNWSLNAKDIGRDTVNLEAVFTGEGKQKFSVRFSKIPHYDFNDGLTPFIPTAENNQVLPQNWVTTTATTQGMTNIDATLAPVAFKQERTRLDLGYERYLSSRWRLQVGLGHETTEGARPMGAVIGSNGGNSRAALVASSIDQSTATVDIALAYTGDSRTLGISYYGSHFDNKADPLVWQNPFAQQTQWAAGVAYPDGFGRLAPDPDNRFQQVQVSGNQVLGKTAQANFLLARGTMRQDEAFLPYTIIDALNPAVALPDADLNGRIDTLNLVLGLSMRPLRNLQLTTRYRVDDRDNKSNRLAFLPVRGDSQPQVADVVLNRPYSYRTAALEVRAGYRATGKLRLNGGWELKSIDRDFSEINDTTEQSWSVGAGYAVSDTLRLSTDLVYERRAGKSYEGNRPLISAHPPGTVADDEFVNHPLLRRYYLADRDRVQTSARLDWMPLDSDFTLGTSVARIREDYGADVFGLNETRYTSWTADLGYQPGASISLTAFVALDKYQQSQSGRAFTSSPAQINNPDRNWWLSPEDLFITASLQLEAKDLQQRLGEWRGSGRLHAGIEASISNARNEMGVEAGPALEALDLPTTRTRSRHLELSARYEMSGANVINVTLSRARYSDSDLRLDDVGPVTMARVLSLGESSHEYGITWFGISYVHHF